MGDHVAVTAAVDARPGKYKLVVVRSRDLRVLRELGAPIGVELPARHGGPEDPRYTSPQDLRRAVGFTIDLLLHLACAVGAFLVLSRSTTLANPFVVLLAAPAAFIAASIVHRIFVQRVFHTTIGKALVGLRLIRDDTGGPPTLGSLTKAWLWGTVMAILNVLSS
jgi:RDD family